MLKIIKIILGQVTLILVMLAIFFKGEFIKGIDLRIIVVTTLISMILIVLNGFSIKLIANAYSSNKKMPLIWAVQIGAISTLGNSLGGLPIGTSIKFLILNKKMEIGCNIL